MQKTIRFLTCIALLLGGCVGTDFVEDPIVVVPPRIAVAPSNTAVEVGRTATFRASYFDSLGSEVTGVTFQWASSNLSIATVDGNGVASGVNTGQTSITASASGLSSDAALLTVVANLNQVAQVVVTPDSGHLQLSQSLQLTATARNLNGDPLSGRSFSWRSSNAAVVSVNPSGLAMALSSGTANLYASTEGVESLPARVEVQSQSRTGMFTQRGGTSYNVSGTAVLEQGTGGNLDLRFGNDFLCSNGPGLHVFLARTNAVASGSLDLGSLKQTSGAQSYDVPAGVNMTTFDWVIIHCVPFNVTFGFARLQ